MQVTLRTRQSALSPAEKRILVSALRAADPVCSPEEARSLLQIRLVLLRAVFTSTKINFNILFSKMRSDKRINDRSLFFPKYYEPNSKLEF